MTSPVLGSVVPVLLVLQAKAMQFVANVGVGATLPDGSAMVTFSVVVAVAFHSSLTVSVTAKVPGAVKVRVGSGPVAVPCVVPNVQAYVSELVSSSVVPLASKVQTFALHDTVAFATGGLFAGCVTTIPVFTRRALTW